MSSYTDNSFTLDKLTKILTFNVKNSLRRVRKKAFYEFSDAYRQRVDGLGFVITPGF